MKVTLLIAKNYDRRFFTTTNARHGYALNFLGSHLDPNTVALARGCDVVCAFVKEFSRSGTRQNRVRLTPNV